MIFNVVTLGFFSSIGISNTVARVLLGIASQKLNRLDELQYTNNISFSDIAMLYLLCFFSIQPLQPRSYVITDIFFFGGGSGEKVVSSVWLSVAYILVSISLAVKMAPVKPNVAFQEWFHQRQQHWWQYYTLKLVSVFIQRIDNIANNYRFNVYLFFVTLQNFRRDQFT